MLITHSTCVYILSSHYRGFMNTLTHTHTHTQQDSCRRRDLFLIANSTHNRLPCHRRNSKSQSQKPSDRRPTIQPARSVGSAAGKQPIFICKMNWLKLLREIEDFYFENHQKHIIHSGKIQNTFFFFFGKWYI